METRVGQINTGLRALLGIPFVYNFFQWFVGVQKAQRKILQSHAELFEHCKVLDIGCAAGEILDILPANIAYTGFDVSADYIEQARKKYGSRGSFFCADVNEVDSLHLKENEYDRAFLFGVLHHLSDAEVDRILSSARRFLKPGGFVMTIDGVYLEHQSKVKRFLLARDRGQHVRFRDHYERLATQVFPATEICIEKNPIRIPVDYIVMRMKKS